MTFTRKTHRTLRIIRIISVTILCTAASFGIGIKTAGEFKAVGAIEANPVDIIGDFDGNGLIDVGDALIALQAERGLVTVTKELLSKDTDGDDIISAADALWVLLKISR